MIEISNVEICGWKPAIRGMRNPKNSWNKSDSCEIDVQNGWDYCVGDNDFNLMMNLSESGSDHRKFMRMLTVYCDVNAPLYWWKEADTYKVGTVANSCSTMHKIHSRDLTLDDFSHEQLTRLALRTLKIAITMLNDLRAEYNQHKDKAHWYSMIQLLPSSYNQKRTLMLNYEVLANMYHSRQFHKLNEWREFCEWIETLPYSELITKGKAKE